MPGTRCEHHNQEGRSRGHRSVAGWFPIAAAFVILLASSACGHNPVQNESAIDLGERFSLLEAGVSKTLDTHVEVTRKGQKREAFILVAPAVVRAPLQGALKVMTLQCLAAPVFDVGDGMQMNVYLTKAGNRIPVGGRYIDPGRKAEDRDWIPVAIPLKVTEGDQLEIEVSAGPQGDLVALRTLLRHRSQLVEHRSPYIQHTLALPQGKCSGGQSGSLRGLESVPAKWRYLVPPTSG